MNKIKFFALLLLLFCSKPVYAYQFSDVDNVSKNMDAIQFLSEVGVIEGYTDGTFRPHQTINRAELVKILLESRGISPSSEVYRDCFPDVAMEWFAKYVCYAKEKNWIDGYPNGYFYPEKPVNKAETLKIIFTITGMSEFPFLTTVHGAEYVDVDKNEWYSYYVYDAKDRGLLEGNNHSFFPAKSITRGEVAEMIFRVVVLTFESKYTYYENRVYDLEHLKDTYLFRKSEGNLEAFQPLGRNLTNMQIYSVLGTLFDTTFEGFISTFEEGDYGEAAEKAKVMVKISNNKLMVLDVIEERGEAEQSWLVENRRLDQVMLDSANELIQTNDALSQEMIAFEEVLKERKVRIDALCLKYPHWTREECTSIADREIWVGMTYEMLLELRGEPDAANPSNYGYGTEWQWCWLDKTPMCFYDTNGDDKVDAYN